MSKSAGKAAERQLKVFVDKFSPPMAALIRAARRQMRSLLPGAVELVYDNYNFFVIGYGPTDRASDAVFSLAAQASGVALCFLQGAALEDPDRLLQGDGKQVRSLRLKLAADLQRPQLRSLIRVACQRAKVPLRPGGEHRLVIKSVSAKQRPRRRTIAASGK